MDVDDGLFVGVVDIDGWLRWEMACGRVSAHHKSALRARG